MKYFIQRLSIEKLLKLLISIPCDPNIFSTGGHLCEIDVLMPVMKLPTVSEGNTNAYILNIHNFLKFIIPRYSHLSIALILFFEKLKIIFSIVFFVKIK